MEQYRCNGFVKAKCPVAQLCDGTYSGGDYRSIGTPEEIIANTEMFAAYRHVCGGLPPEKISGLIKAEQKRREGCEYCDFSSGSCGAEFDGADNFFLLEVESGTEFYIATDGGGIFRESKIDFCPMCGRDLRGDSYERNDN